MSATSATADFPLPVRQAVPTTQLSLVDRLLLATAVFEIPLQLDKYFLFSEADGDLGAVAGLNVSITTICLALLYANWLVSAAVTQLRSTFSVVLGAPMIAYLVCNILSVAVADRPLLALFDVWLLLQSYLLFFYVANRLVSNQDLLFLLKIIAASLLVQALLIMGLAALGPSFHGREIGIGPFGLSVRADGRPEGTVHSPNGAGSLVYLLVAVSWPLMFAAKESTWRRLTWLAVAFGIIAICLTQTRGAMLSIGIGAAVVVLLAFYGRWISIRLVVLTGVIGLLGSVAVLAVLSQRGEEESGQSALSRLSLAAIAFDAIEQRPLLGAGAGNCHIATQRYANQSEFRSDWFFTTHCKYLVVWVETGLCGLIAFLWMLASGIWRCLSLVRNGDRLLALVGVACCAGLLGQMAHMFVDIFNSRVNVQSLWLVLAITVVAIRLAHNGRQEHGRQEHGDIRNTATEHGWVGQ